jgi:hypothetical protein
MVNGSSNAKIEELLAEILKWIKFSGAKEVRGVLESTLDTDQKRLIYDLSDGDRGSVEIGKASNTSDRTVRRYWESWARRGLMESLRVRGGDRYKKSFRLEDFDIKVPETQVETPPSGASEAAPAEASQAALEAIAQPVPSANTEEVEKDG